MISQTSRYALHILGYLAFRRGDRVAGEEIARATGVPATYLSKILNQLRKGGIVDSRKGWGGGFLLIEGALERPIADVLASVDGPHAILRTDCLFGLPECDCENPCPLHSSWETIRETYHTMLNETQIADLSTGNR